MFKPRYIGSILLVALMLTTTIGIGIYKHTCLVTGQEGITLFVSAEAGVSNLHVCCANKEASQTKKKGCCEESTSFYQLDIPQKTEEHYAYGAPVLPVVGIIHLATFELAIVEQTAFLPLYNNLPPPSMQSRLAQLQVYTL